MKNFMRNHKEKGYPDSHHVPDGNSSSSSSAMSMGGSSTLPKPAGFPSTIDQGTQNSSLIQPPIAYPDAVHQEVRESGGLSKGTVNIGFNQNDWGRQKLRNVRIGNRAAGSELASSSPLYGQFSHSSIFISCIPKNINAGYNTNGVTGQKFQ